MEVLKQYRVIGPPGSGKTTFLSRQLANAADVYGPSNLIVVSLTNASASRVVEKIVADGVLIPEDNISTLHSLALRAAGGVGDGLAEKKSEEFNEYDKSWSLSGKVDDDGRPTPATRGDWALNQANINRAKMVPFEKWDRYVREFYESWRAWKTDNGYIDYTDMLEIALNDSDECPGKPAAIFVDEAQDLSKLGWALVRKWGEKCIRFITVGDPWQLLYGFAGSDVDSFYEPELPPEQIRVLDQSWRVPKKVLNEARAWIDRTPGRMPEAYKPTKNDGEVVRGHPPMKFVNDMVLTICEELAADRTVAVIAANKYVLLKLRAVLMEEGTPFHNPYAPDNAFFNPLHRPGSATSTDRMVAFMRCSVDLTPWTWYDLNCWVEWLGKGVLHHGAKKRIEDEAAEMPGATIARTIDDIINSDDLLSIMPREAWLEAISGNYSWFMQSIKPDKFSSFHYPEHILRRHGMPGLEETPRLILSTIHSIKGGECDTAIVCPDLTMKQYENWDMRDGAAEKEELRRAFYVAMTRPRHKLILCDPSSRLAVQW